MTDKPHHPSLVTISSGGNHGSDVNRSNNNITYSHYAIMDSHHGNNGFVDKIHGNADIVNSHGHHGNRSAHSPDGSSDEYDTDVEPDTGAASGDPGSDPELSALTYLAACDLLHVTPVRRVLASLGQTEIGLRYRNLGPRGAQALAAALGRNTHVKTLDLEANGLGPEGGDYIADMLKDNQTISHVNLSKNQLGGCGARRLSSMLKNNSVVEHLDLSENRLGDQDAKKLAAGIEKNERVVYLDLSKNDFSEEGAVHLGRALGSNNSVEILDLSWNQLRRKGTLAVCTGLQRNYCISTLALSWNGLSQEGALAVGDLIRGNKYIRELDISHNRVNWEGALHLARGLKENDTLEVFKVSHNPLTMTGVLDLLEAVDNPVSVCNTVDFEGIPVNRKIVYMTETLQKTRPLKVTHGGLLEGDDIFGKRMVLRCDPLKLLIQFLSDKGIRPVDLFRTFDKDNQHKVPREQFIQGLKKAKVPLDEYELERVLNRLDSAKEGKISYQRLMRGVKEQIKVNRAEEKRRHLEERRHQDEHRRLLNLPAITETASRMVSPSHTSLAHSSNHRPSLSQPGRPDSASSAASELRLIQAPSLLDCEMEGRLYGSSLLDCDPHLVSSKTSVGSKSSSRVSSRAALPRIQGGMGQGSRSVNQDPGGAGGVGQAAKGLVGIRK